VKGLHVVTFILVVVGALNWGLVGLFNFNLVNLIFGTVPWLERLVYVVVGLAAIYEAVVHTKLCKACGK
jgi:uncharacterized protein